MASLKSSEAYRRTRYFKPMNEDGCLVGAVSLGDCRSGGLVWHLRAIGRSGAGVYLRAEAGAERICETVRHRVETNDRKNRA
jgi:hypothetical protein